MPEIIKFTGLVLKKINYGDTSKIATFFTGEYGKITGILKGGRSSKSKIGSVVDQLNEVEIILYSKPNREVQLISQANLSRSFPGIKSDLDALKYSSAILELLDYFIMENEAHERLYRGVIRILDLINNDPQSTQVYFVKFMLFFLDEIGFGLNLDNCKICGKKFKEGEKGLNLELGFICEDCKSDHLVSYNLNEELFNNLVCLSTKNDNNIYNNEDLNKLILILERVIMFHSPDFPGIKSLKVFN